ADAHAAAGTPPPAAGRALRRPGRAHPAGTPGLAARDVVLRLAGRAPRHPRRPGSRRALGPHLRHEPLARHDRRRGPRASRRPGAGRTTARGARAPGAGGAAPGGRGAMIEPSPQPGLGARLGAGALNVVPPVLIVVALFVAWEVYVELSGISRVTLPAPSRVLTAAWRNRDVLAEHSLVTLQETFLGLAVSITLGVLL